jgi:pimeloyl-ACP methyl ester carboxylesterase
MNKELLLTIDDENLPIWIKGNKSAKTVLLCLHGGPGNGSGPCQRSKLHLGLEEEYMLIYFNQRYSKQVIPPHIRLTQQQIVNDVMAVKAIVDQHIKYDKIFLLGVSFGGCVGFLTVQQHAARFNGYIALCPAVLFSEVDIVHRQNKVRTLLFELTQQSLTLEEFSRYKDEVVKLPVWITHVIAMRDWFITKTFLGIFNQLELPTLIIQGDQDELTPEAVLTDGIRQSTSELITYTIIEGHGHNLTDNVYNDIDKHIIKFIEALI